MTTILETGTNSPDQPMADDSPMTLPQIRDLLNTVREWISDGYEYSETMEVDGEYVSGKDLCDDLHRAESMLYLTERKIKEATK